VSADPVSPLLLLYAPAALRHGPSPAAECRILAADSRGTDTGTPNTVVIPAAGAPAALTPAAAGGSCLAPLFCLLRAGRRVWLPYTLVSYTGEDLLFIALPPPALHGDPGQQAQLQAWSADLASRHRRHPGQLGNHGCWFRDLLPGLEIEHKFTLAAGADIWQLAVRTHQAVKAGQLHGWITEHGNNGGFEQWDFLNHLFAITRPEAERGYIAFLPGISTDAWIIRHKRFASDRETRREDVIRGVDLGPRPDLEQVIRDRFGVCPAWGATYRRVRYNIKLESLATGHLYSVMYDRCTAPDLPGAPPLVQAEVEYIRSRTLRTDCDGDVTDGLQQLTAWTRSFLRNESTGFAEDHMSKLTWLSNHR
jgi:hypothetical protein